MQDGLLLSVRATPKGGRDAIDGVECLADGSPMLKARVRAAPADGGANKALIRVIAKAAGVPPSAVALVRGQTARNKTFRLTGNPAALAAAFERTLSLKTGKA
jgi:uncharacterized protein (TIGR00251 family)